MTGEDTAREEKVAEAPVTDAPVTDAAVPEAPTIPDAPETEAAVPEAPTVPDAPETEAATPDEAQALETVEPAEVAEAVALASEVQVSPEIDVTPGIDVTPADVVPSPVSALPGPAVPVAPSSGAPAGSWGRADDDGTVYVRTADGERSVGQYPGATPDEAIAYFHRKFEDLEAQVKLLEQRLKANQVSAADADATIKRLRPTIHDANVVGDIDSLLARLDGLSPLAAEARAAAQAAKQEAKAAAALVRTALVEEAEALAEPDPQRIPWKTSGDRLRVLFDEWKRMQRESRLDKPVEDELWKRFSHARTSFDRKRRHHFGALDEQRTAARAEKERLVAEAEALSSSTDWGRTSGVFRDLMTQWKASGRAQKKDDDELWGRFRGAQDAFFAARDAANSRQNEEFQGNLGVKEQVLADAQKLLPVKNIGAAKSALRDLQSRWDAAGKVPRADMARLEAAFRKVEQAVQDADQERWRRSNPEARARAADLVAQLEKTIASLERDLEKARTAGNDRKARDAEQSLAARREWLEQARRGLDEFTG